MKQEIRQFLIRTLGWFGIFLLLVLIIFEALPIMHSNTLNTFHLIARQRVLEQRIVKDALTLAYRPQSEHPEAISELQTALPMWEKVQNGFQTGDASLSISSRMPDNIRLLLSQMQPDFVYMDAAARQMLAHHEPVDPDQLTIIMQYEQDYYLIMAQTVSLFQDDIDNAAQVYFYIELVIGILLMIIWIVFAISMHRMLKKANKE